MSKESFNGSYLIRSNHIDKKCFIGKYDAEGKLQKIFNGPKSKDSRIKKHPLIEHLKYWIKSRNEYKREISKVVGHHVYFVPIETRGDYWSYKKALDEQSNKEDSNIFLKYKIHKFDKNHPFHMIETDDHSEIDEFDSFTKRDAGEVIKFFKKNIFNKTKK